MYSFQDTFFQKGHVACPGYVNRGVDVWNDRGTKFHGERNFSHLRRAPQPAQVLLSALIFRVVVPRFFYVHNASSQAGNIARKCAGVVEQKERDAATAGIHRPGVLL